MGLWSSTFGGGNSFKESVANTFTPSDGAKYEKGNLVHDGGSNSGKSFTPNTVSHTGDTISGSANTKTNVKILAVGWSIQKKMIPILSIPIMH